MTHELTYLTWVTTLTALLWAPYILNRIVVGKGVLHEVGYPDEPTVLSPWAERLKRAHHNAVENLVVFAPLVLIAHVVGARGDATWWAATIYFWARVAHVLSYTFAIPWVRTLSFVVGWGCQMAFAWTILRAGGVS
jgi:uncharacterized MAPEG superfamily protein